MIAPVQTTMLNGFDDPRCPPEQWNALLCHGNTDVPFLTWEWQRSWWDSFNRSGLLLIAVTRAGHLVAIAPFFVEEDLVYFVGSGGSDYLDFVGDIHSPEVLESALRAARTAVKNFVGFRFFHLLENSRTTRLLHIVATQLGLIIRDEGGLSAPALSLVESQIAGSAATKKSLLRHERFFVQNGDLRISHSSTASEIVPCLSGFFEQHVERWKGTSHPSLFRDGKQRQFYERLAERASASGWLRFTRLEWNRTLIASHFGFCYGGTFMWYKPTFDLALARRSPGEVLIRQLLLRAVEEGAHTFDFGLGDEPFKKRFATHTRNVRNWGLYPQDVSMPAIL
jgi:CelD/BcsL family acetyltransferase involved in cellulose biosynthesis